MDVVETKGWKDIDEWEMWVHDNTKGTMRKLKLPNRFNQSEDAFLKG